MDVPFWEFGGSTVVTSSYVRLTPDRQSKRGVLWNTVVSWPESHWAGYGLPCVSTAWMLMCRMHTHTVY